MAPKPKDYQDCKLLAILHNLEAKFYDDSSYLAWFQAQGNKALKARFPKAPLSTYSHWRGQFHTYSDFFHDMGQPKKTTKKAPNGKTIYLPTYLSNRPLSIYSHT